MGLSEHPAITRHSDTPRQILLDRLRQDFHIGLVTVPDPDEIDDEFDDNNAESGIQI